MKLLFYRFVIGIVVCLEYSLSFGLIGTEIFTDEKIRCLQFVQSNLRVWEVGV